MDPVRLTVALGPICVYLVVIGWLNTSKRPFVTNGTRDLLALAVALIGLVAVGPIELFMPERAAAVFGVMVWIPLVVLYLLVSLLIAMVSKPRLVVYNITADQLRPVVGSVVSDLDHEARWAGDSVSLPNLHIQLFVQSHPGMRNVQLVASGGDQNLASWKQLELTLQQALANFEVGMNPRAISFFLSATIMACVIVFFLFAGRELIAERMQDFLRL